MRKVFRILLAGLTIWLILFSLPVAAFAHEAYVLRPERLAYGLAMNSSFSWAGFFSPIYLPVTFLMLGLGSVIYGLYFIWAGTKWADRLDETVRKWSGHGRLAVRLAIGVAFLFGAMGNAVFGPEQSLSGVLFGQSIVFLEFAIGLAFLFGVFTEAAAIAGFLIYVFVAIVYGSYTITYFSYWGGLIVLGLFGSRFRSVDGLLFGKKTWIKGWEKYNEWEIPILRICLGVALIYTAISVKFLHQNLTIEVINQFDLTKYLFNWSPEYIAAGTGVVELVVGVLILLGFAQRLTVVIFMFFMTLLLFYFREAVWPHLMLYGISVAIFIEPGDRLTIDRYLIPILRKRITNYVLSITGKK